MTVWPLAVYFAAVLLIVVVMLSLSYVLGQRHDEPSTGSQYESGIVSEGSAQARLSVKFFLTAAFFVVFDLEAVFLFLWAVAGRDLGWSGYVEMAIFVGVLLAALVYLWRTGALDWYPATARGKERP
ncbi:MAG TPA: NADH-quinone oxidoreductase subunit A [Edaphobacter sp.]|uniref:NADH-quinone oxidoreductase subunit A n=1 Tax=Edaphobacter sp. TaxID=1934404 RepID=UPI002C08D411|nr:NADH-quinone oxidoreductase subunit A [Edaphobacter sp.]HUZ94660.1 NADH-quinone oxidoreductase subunit A [Edaphobacter sp.]